LAQVRGYECALATTNLDETAVHKILIGPTDGDATDLESHNKAVFGRQLFADLQISIGHLASEECFDPCIEKTVTRPLTWRH
jgi:hypothetical protein